MVLCRHSCAFCLAIFPELVRACCVLDGKSRMVERNFDEYMSNLERYSLLGLSKPIGSAA